MSRDDIIRMAREAGFANVRGGLMDNGELSDYWDCWPSQLERFAAFVAALSARRGEPACPHIRSSGPADRATHWCALAATPPEQRRPLTDEQIDRITDQQWATNNHKPVYAAHRAYARAVEQAHDIGGEK